MLIKSSREMVCRSRSKTSPSTPLDLAPQNRMEGLIPLVYKAIKRRNTTKHYRSLSTGGALNDESELNFNDRAFVAAPSENQNQKAVFEMNDYRIFTTPQGDKLEDCSNGKGDDGRQKQGPMQALPRETFLPVKRVEPVGKGGYRGRSKSVA